MFARTYRFAKTCYTIFTDTAYCNRQRGIFDRIYHLRDLLGFPSPVAAISVEHTQLVLIMQEVECGQIGIAVDEAVGEIDLFVKSLKSYLQHPGVIGTAIDGKGSVTLVVHLLSLVRNYTHSVPFHGRWKVKQSPRKPSAVHKDLTYFLSGIFDSIGPL